MKGLDLRNKNMLFIFQCLCLFTFCQHKLPIVARFFKGYASLEVMRQRDVAMDITFLTGLRYGKNWIRQREYNNQPKPFPIIYLEIGAV
jgi:hypothetical protein